MKKMSSRIFALAVIILSLTGTVLPPVFAATNLDKTIPSPTTNFFVNDYAETLSDTTEAQIQNAAVALYKATKAQVVVVTVPSLEGYPLEDYSLTVFRNWGIGDAKLDNGVLLLLALDERQMRIQVGSGLEGALNDGKTGRIQDEYMIPYFKNKDFDTGMLGGFTKVVEVVYEEYKLAVPTDVDASQYYNSVDYSNSGDTEVHPAVVVIVVILILLDVIFNRGRITRILFYALSRGGGRGRGGGGGFGGGGGSSSGGGSSRSF